ncbi:hypothetical protein JW890_01630 [candidate division WOR-3 bacterium]|nr:hypothetical protein [candidate division WOR-3 bacterium]
MSIRAEIFSILEKKPGLHYREITLILRESGIKAKQGSVNALMSQDSRFISDGEGHWRVADKIQTDDVLMSQITDVLSRKNKPMPISEIVTELVKIQAIKPQEEFAVKKVLIANNFRRWGTSDYFALKNEDIPTDSIGDFFASRIIEFFETYKLPLHRTDLAKQISESSGIYIDPDGGFYAELSRLVKKNIVANLGNSLIAPEKSNKSRYHSSVAEMINAVLSERQKPMLFRELKKFITEKFGIEIKNNTLSSTLTEDERFSSARRGFWHLKKWEFEKSRSLYQPGTRKDYTTAPLSEKSVSEGCVILRPLIYEFFPESSTQIIIQSNGEKILAEYDDEKKKLLGAKKLIQSLEVQKGDRLRFSLKDPKLKVYSAQKEPSETAEDIPEKKMAIPAKSCRKTLFVLRDFLEKNTSFGETGAVLTIQSGVDISKMLFSSGRRVIYKPACPTENILCRIPFRNKKSEMQLTRKIRDFISKKIGEFTEASRKYYYTGKRCASCGAETVVFRHELGTETGETLCSNHRCRMSFVRNAVSVKFSEQDFLAFRENLDIDEQREEGNPVYGKISRGLEMTTRNKLSAAFIISEIENIEDADMKKFLYASLIQTLDKNLCRPLMTDENLFHGFFSSCSDLFRLRKELNSFSLSEQSEYDFAVLSDAEPSSEKFFTDIFSEILGVEKIKVDCFSEALDIIRKIKSPGMVFLIRKIEFGKKTSSVPSAYNFLCENLKNVFKGDNIFEGEQIIGFEK